MLQKPRDSESARFVKQYTDEDFIEALETALSEATATAAEVANLLGCNSRYATIRLKELAVQDKIEGVMKGRTWGFRLKKSQKREFF